MSYGMFAVAGSIERNDSQRRAGSSVGSLRGGWPRLFCGKNDSR
jgi:hypothetical protein